MSLLLPLLMLLRVTFFHDTGSPMANGQMPFVGAAACSQHFALGTVIRLKERYDYVCLDRGHFGTRPWVDIYAATAEEGVFVARNFSPYAVGQLLREGRE